MSNQGTATPSPLPTPTSSAPPTPSEEDGGDHPDLSQLSLTLSRDQGKFHRPGDGGGSESLTLSRTAHSQHDFLAPHVLKPRHFRVFEHESAPGSGSSSVAGTHADRSPAAGDASSTVASPGASTPDTRPETPALMTSITPHASDNATPTAAVAPAPHLAHRPSHAPSEKEGKKSVFGKLFDRNGSSASVRADNADGTSAPNLVRQPSGHKKEGADLARKVSKKEEKEREKREKEERKAEERAAKEAHEQASNRPRSASAVSDKSHHHHEGKSQGMGAALNDFMRHKVQRKTSVTSKKSDDGRSEAGKSEGDKSETRSRASTSLTKKYGVCEKIAIGKGATATVRLAHKWDRSTERLYAIKEFRKRRKNETEKEYVKKLTSEFCISSTLHHQNIVETVDLVQDEQQHWCEVMEYCPGGDLYAAIKKGNMTPVEVNSYFKQILSGVAYLHSMGVAHRDIKPENIMLDAKGHVKLGDFGVASVFRMCWEKEVHLSSGLCGSEPYIAPEQFEQKEYDARLVDVWATAIVMYCLELQELPWRVAKRSDASFGPYLQLYNDSATPPPISNLQGRERRNVVKRMLNPDPNGRPQAKDILEDPWVTTIVIVP